MDRPNSPRARAAAARLPCEVIEGLHAGAVLELQAPVCNVGSGEGCDLVLRDEGVAGLHASLLYGRRRWWIRPSPNTRVLLDGQPLEPRTTALPSSCELVLGQARLRLGTGMPQPAQAPAAPALSTPPSLPLRAASWRWVTGGGILATGLLLALATVMQPAVVAREPASTPERVMADLQNAGFHGLKLQPGATRERAVISGYVERHADLQRLRQARPLSGQQAYVLRVQAMEDLVAQVANFIGDPALRVRAPAPGQVSIEGEASRATTRTRLTKLEKELGASLEISAAVSYPEDKPKASGTDRWVRSAAEVGWKIKQVGAAPSGRYLEMQDGTKVFDGGRIGAIEVLKVDPTEVWVQEGSRIGAIRVE